MIRVLLYNDYHRKQTIVRIPSIGYGVLSRQQLKRAEKKLCGIKDCKCGGILRDKLVKQTNDGKVWVRGPLEPSFEEQGIK